MYAILFDLDTKMLQDTYHNGSWNNAYKDIKDFLLAKGFDWQQGSVYYGSPSVTPVTCVIAVQDLAREFSWFAPSVRDIQMLRIEENSDLTPALPSNSSR